MEREFACRDVGMNCDYKIRGYSDDELLQKAEMHGREAHGMKDLSEDTKQKIRSAIHDVPSEQPQTKIA